MIPAPKVKLDSYDLLRKGLLGNTLRTWSSFNDLITDPEFEGDVGALRLKSTPGVRPPDYCVPLRLSALAVLAQEWNGLGIPSSLIVFCETDSTYRSTIKGEVYLNQGGVSLRYSFLQGFLNDVLKEQSLLAEGLKAQMILKTYMDHPSYENLMHLLDTYEDGIVEFTCYDQIVGDLGWNTVFWELRNY